jgi:hypothetical protein
MSTTVVPHADQDAVLAALAVRLTATPGLLLLLLDTPGCDGTSCDMPAFRDRSTGAWRHLRDLSRCHATRPPRRGSPAADAETAGERP